jgi:hypothetical protein
MQKKWFYIGNLGTLIEEDKWDILEGHCNNKGPEDLRKFKSVPFHVIRNMITEAKAAVAKKEEVSEKPKRKRRTKAEIEADNKKAEEGK